jgi:antitoxin component YwqK of YwqJK toxin-antitoxin module
MKLLSLLLAMACSMVSYCQKEDTTWWVQHLRIQTITQHSGNNLSIRSWHANGRPMSSGVFEIKNGYTPLTNIVILDSTGKKVQEYLADEGSLINYIPSGKVEDILQAPMGDTAQRYTEYYTNGTIKTSWFAKKDSGKNGIYFFPPNYSKPISYMYQQERHGPWLLQSFYPSGKPYFVQQYTSPPTSRQLNTWYTESGEVDSAAYIDMGKSRYSFDKVGPRLEWWNNGHIKSKENFKANHPDGMQRTWHENGRPRSEQYFIDGSYMGFARSWYDDGQLQYYADYRIATYGNPTLYFHANGHIKTHGGVITSSYDEVGRITNEYIYISMLNIHSFDIRNELMNSNGPIKKNARFEGIFNKMRTGPWRAYDNNDRMLYSVTYKDGLLSGAALFFDTTGLLHLKANFLEGQLHGEYLCMNANGRDTLE